jgi:hypothetical protein
MATKFNRNIKVSQATIDKIKKQGMTASLKGASGNNSPEYREALRRMYGDARVAKATASTKPSSSGRYVGSMFVPDKAPAKGPSTAYSPAPMKARTSYSPTPYKSTAAKPKPKPKANGSQRLAQPLYNAIGNAFANTPKAQRDRRNKAKAAAAAAAAKKNK